MLSVRGAKVLPPLGDLGYDRCGWFIGVFLSMEPLAGGIWTVLACDWIGEHLQVEWFLSCGVHQWCPNNSENVSFLSHSSMVETNYYFTSRILIIYKENCHISITTVLQNMWYYSWKIDILTEKCWFICVNTKLSWYVTMKILLRD